MPDFDPSVERWAPIPGWEDAYEASTHGRVRRIARAKRTYVGRLLQGCKRRGYLFVTLYYQRKREVVAIHRLVLLTFSGPPQPGDEARHLNGNGEDNRIENLSWGSHAENMQDRVKHGRHNTRLYGSPNKRFGDNDIAQLLSLVHGGMPTAKAGATLGMSKTASYRFVRIRRRVS